MLILYAAILFVAVALIAAISKVVYGERYAEVWREDLEGALEDLGITINRDR